jgi:hypothetical protein
MAGFAKFDPRPFLESEQRTAAGPTGTVTDTTRTATNAETLATLAALAGRPLKNEIRGTASKVLLQFDTDAVTAKSIEIQRDDRTLIHGLGKNQNLTPTPAKVAKVAKVKSSVAATEEALWAKTEEERAAIAEYDGGAPRAWAEALARLDPNKPPGDVPTQRWLRFVDDCGRFLDGGWAVRAAAFGWGPLDLFGCDRERPFACVDHLGLLWLLNGASVVELHRDRAILETERGAHQCYRRRPVEVGRVVLAWELSL